MNAGFDGSIASSLLIDVPCSEFGKHCVMWRGVNSGHGYIVYHIGICGNGCIRCGERMTLGGGVAEVRYGRISLS